MSEPSDELKAQIQAELAKMEQEKNQEATPTGTQVTPSGESENKSEPVAEPAPVAPERTSEPEPEPEPKLAPETELENKPEVQSPAVPEPAPQPVSSAPASKPEPAQGTPSPKVTADNTGKWALMLLVALLVAAGVYAGYKYLPHRAIKSVADKQDISLIRYGLNDEGGVDKFYPQNDTETEDSTPFDVNMQVFEGLVKFDNLKQIKPLLATGWTNPDDNTWVFTLQPNVKFHDGNVLTAKDVKYSLDNFKDSETGKAFNTTIKSVDVVDDTHVKITTNGPDPLLLNRLAFLYVVDSRGKAGSPDTGTGPYTTKPGTTATYDKAELVAFDGWHGGHQYARAVTYQNFHTEDELVAAVTKGDIDIAEDIFSSDNISKVDSAHVAMSFQSTGQSVLTLNTRKAKAPLADKRVRQAVYDLIDQSKLLAARGISGVVVNQIVPKDVPGYNPNIPDHKQNVEEAKSLLAAAGYVKGFTLEFPYLTDNNSPLFDELAKELAVGGIKIKYVPYKDSESLNDYTRQNKYDVQGYGWDTQILDASDIISQAFQSPTYDNPAIDAKLKTANSTIDEAKRLAMMQDISKDLMDDVAWIPMYSRLQHFIVPKNYVINRDSPGEAFGVNFATVYAKPAAKE